MKKTEKSKLVNYVLSIGFVLLIVLFLLSLIGISRYVLSDEVSPIKNHVATTKILLDDIEDFEKSVERLSDDFKVFDMTNELLRYNNYDKNIIDFAYVNINENKSVVSMFFNSEVDKINNIYYLKIKDISELEKGDYIIYENLGNIQINKIFMIENNNIKISDFQSKEIKIEFADVLGKIVYEEK